MAHGSVIEPAKARQAAETGSRKGSELSEAEVVVPKARDGADSKLGSFGMFWCDGMVGWSHTRWFNWVRSPIFVDDLPPQKSHLSPML